MTGNLRLPTLAEIEAAAARMKGHILRTPLIRLEAGIPDTTIYLKLENLQPIGSFKIRAGFNALAMLMPDQRAQGVITASSGNFGQGVAYAARAMGASATVVVPEGSALTKALALERLGAKIIRLPYNDWWQVLMTRHCDGETGIFLHPVSESPVVAGNATAGLEIVEDLDDFDTVVVPFGGGGLISGIGATMRLLRPSVKMIAAESEACQPAAAALKAGRPVTVPFNQSFVDGMGTSTVLPEMWPLIRQTVDAAVSSSFAEIAGAIRLLAAQAHIIAEGAGAASVAAALAGRAGRGNIVCVVSGGNIDNDKLIPILCGEDPF